MRGLKNCDSRRTVQGGRSRCARWAPSAGRSWFESSDTRLAAAHRSRAPGRRHFLWTGDGAVPGAARLCGVPLQPYRQPLLAPGRDGASHHRLHRRPNQHHVGALPTLKTQACYLGLVDGQTDTMVGRAWQRASGPLRADSRRSPNRGHYQTTRPPLKKCPLKNPRRKLSPRGQYSSTGKQVNGTSHGTSTVSLTVPILVSGEACQPPPLVEGDSHVCSEARGWHPNARAPAGL
eukprot:1180677-Prorocentrum_minimum.AAC.3